MQITEFKKVGKSNKIKIFVDGEFFGVVIDETIIENNLKLNKEYSLETLNKIVFDGQKKVALDSAITLLSSFNKTEKELKDYLKKKGFLNEAITYTLDKLKSYNYLNDETYAKNYINLKQNYKGKKAISFELKHKGIDENIIRKYLDSIQHQQEIVVTLANKFAKNKKNDVKIKEKLFRHLASKGFDYEDINFAIKQVLNSNLEEY